MFVSFEYVLSLLEEGKTFCGFMQKDVPVQYFTGYKSAAARHSVIQLNSVLAENCMGSYIGGI
jgi:hypothetical protein